MLHERLNIGREALDYFCASSSILKAGIKAGLTLYDIAVMCCRNDNLGEVPSKLEALFSMAADLAESAIENGRWHHAAASKALAEQLSPNAGSLLTGPNVRMTKSVSAIDINQYSDGLSSLAVTSKQDVMPGMIQSSASDSSSDSGEIEQDDCEEWAAALVADVSMERSFSLINTTKHGRSHSIESDGSNEDQSPKGFWHTRPSDFGEPGSRDDDDDESWISWGSDDETEDLMPSMFVSPMTPEKRNSFNPFDNEHRGSLTALQDGDSKALFQKARSPTKVKFNTTLEHTKSEEEIEEARYKHSNSDVGKSMTIFSQHPEKGVIKRSQSYSALSSTSIHKVTSHEDNAPKISRPFVEDQEQYRDYFLKFVDLVIVRETTAASMSAKQGE